MTSFIANSIFWSAIGVMVIIIYQAAILPGIRLGLRYHTFALRDRLRKLAMNGIVKESDEAFQVLHSNLNSMSVSLARYDLARVVQAVGAMDEGMRARVSANLQVMKSAPPEVKVIYQESLHVFTLVLIFNHLFFFVAAGLCFAVFMLVKVGLLRFKDAVVRKLDEESKLAFFSPELCAV